ncbi:MAG TPA: galactokinase [Acidimicrobiia bacterium]|nr:galactokinase [Acidimicrobiia bacterium]
MAIEQSIWMAVAVRPQRRLRIESTALGSAEVGLDYIERSGGYVDYVAGVIALQNPDICGLDLWIDSDVPLGAGLSSSGALSVASVFAVTEASGGRWDPMTAALLARRVENEWVGVATGIMDPLIISGAVAGAASLIDCRSLQITQIQLPAQVAVAVLDSGTRRQLTSSDYNDRRAACERAAEFLGVGKLRDADLDMLDRSLLTPPDSRRARHVITENSRTLEFAHALGRSEFARAGELMIESHSSLRDDFEVSSPSLDVLVEAALEAPGCFGARLTGAGMGGCAVALVSLREWDEFASSLGRRLQPGTDAKSALCRAYPRRGAHVAWRRGRPE